MYRLTFLFLIFSSAVFSQVNTLKQLNQALSEARKENDFEKLATAYFDLALYQKKLNLNPERSFENFSRSQEYYQLINDSIGYYKCKFQISSQLLENGMYDEAYENLKSLQQFNLDKDAQSRAEIELQFFNYYLQKLDTEHCKESLDKLEGDLNTLGDGEIHLGFMASKIAYHELLLELDSSFYYAELCIDYAEKQNNKLGRSQCQLLQGKILSKLDLCNQAISVLESSLDMLNRIPYSNDRLKAYKYLSDCYLKSLNYKLAQSYTISYAQLQDSILNENRIVAVNNLTHKYESKEKAAAIRLLEKDKAFVQENNQQQRRALIVLGLALTGLVIGIYYIIRFYTDRIKAVKIIEEQNEKISQQKITELQDRIQINSMQSMIAGQEDERERIAKDLHDSLGGLLSTIKLQIDNIQDKDGNVDRLPDFKKATKLLDFAVSEVRTISQNLQPGALKRLGLVPALYDLVNRYRTNQGPEITFQYFDVPSDLDQAFAMSVYRIIQELLNNALKHSQAKEIFIQLNKEGEDIVIHFEDDGIGFDANKIYKSMGLENIKSRVNYLKGTMEIDSRKQEGTSFVIHLNTNFDQGANSNI